MPCQTDHDHKYLTVTKSWQTADFFHGVLYHSEQVMVCQNCGRVLKIFEKKQ